MTPAEAARVLRANREKLAAITVIVRRYRKLPPWCEAMDAAALLREIEAELRKP